MTIENEEIYDLNDMTIDNEEENNIEFLQNCISGDFTDECVNETKLPFLIETFIQKNELCGLHGAGGISKSMMALYMAVSVASGYHFFDHEVIKGKVLYITMEDDKTVFKNRLYHIYKNYGWVVNNKWFNLQYKEDLSKNLNFMFLGRENFSFITDKRKEDLVEVIIKGKYDFVIIDTLRKYDRSFNENASEEMTSVLCSMFPCLPFSTVLFIHHDNKGGGERGSGAFRDSCRNILHLERDKEKNCKLWVTKSNHGPDGEDSALNYRLHFNQDEKFKVEILEKHVNGNLDETEAKNKIIEFIKGCNEVKYKDEIGFTCTKLSLIQHITEDNTLDRRSSLYKITDQLIENILGKHLYQLNNNVVQVKGESIKHKGYFISKQFIYENQEITDFDSISISDENTLQFKGDFE